MKNKKSAKILGVFLLFFMLAGGIVFTGCGAFPDYRLMDYSLNQITKMEISGSGNEKFEITDEAQIKDVFDRFNRAGLERKPKKTVFGKVGDQGTPVYKFTVEYEEGEELMWEGFSVNATYVDYWKTEIDQCYLQSRKSDSEVYFKEISREDFDFIKTLFEHFEE